MPESNYEFKCNFCGGKCTHIIGDDSSSITHSEPVCENFTNEPSFIKRNHLAKVDDNGRS